MPLDDLDLVFDDEDENKKKKNDSHIVDQEISFAVSESHSPSVKSSPTIDKKVLPSNGDVKSMEEFKAQKSINSASQGQDATARDLRAQPQSNEVYQAALKQAEMKLLISEYRLDLLSELNGDIKLIDYQINQLLIRIHHKHPDVKAEILAIKKVLAEFTAKKRK